MSAASRTCRLAGALSIQALPLHRFQEFDQLSAPERTFLETLVSSTENVRKSARLQEQGITQHSVYFLISGWVTCSITLANGSQQIVKVHLPGDLMGFSNVALRQTADTLVAVTDATVAKVPVSAVGTIFTALPHLAALMFLSAQRERIALMDALTSMGQTSAVSRLAAFVLDVFDRATAAGVCAGQSFDLPLSQPQIGDLAGISAVHVNRSVGQLRESGFLSWNKQRVIIHNKAGLERIAVRVERSLNYNPGWLPRSVVPPTG